VAILLITIAAAAKVMTIQVRLIRNIITSRVTITIIRNTITILHIIGTIIIIVTMETI
jgi:hypothetical protein